MPTANMNRRVSAGSATRMTVDDGLVGEGPVVKAGAPSGTARAATGREGYSVGCTAGEGSGAKKSGRF